jgi:uncharacterized protein YndB with AHSA1/START domain
MKNRLRVSVSRDYRAPPQSLWRLLTDTALWPRWGPTVRSVACSERFIREGSVGKVRTPIGLWLPFTITEYEESHYWAWKVAGIRATGHRLITFNDHFCRVVFELPATWLPYALVCRKAAANMAVLVGST